MERRTSLYVDSGGAVTAYDPSLTERGPKSLLVKKEALTQALEREDLRLVWEVRGEKQVLVDGPRLVDHPRWLYLNAVCYYDDKGELVSSYKSEHRNT